jgi:hypothetical protein
MKITVGQYHSHVRVIIRNEQDGAEGDQGITLDVPLVQALMLAVSITAEVTNVLRGMLGLQQQAQPGGNGAQMPVVSPVLEPAPTDQAPAQAEQKAP